VLIDSTAGNSALKSFGIAIKAYGVQAEGLDYTAAKAQLDALMIAQP